MLKLLLLQPWDWLNCENKRESDSAGCVKKTECSGGTGGAGCSEVGNLSPLASYLLLITSPLSFV